MADLLEQSHRFGPGCVDGARAESSTCIRTTDVYLVFTSVAPTLRAARVAHTMARALGAPLTLIHFRPVPFASAARARFGSPIDDEFVDKLRSEGIDTRVRVFLCRDGRKVIPRAFRPGSLIVVGGRRSRWPTEAERWRRALEIRGHFVLFVDEGSHAA